MVSVSCGIITSTRTIRTRATSTKVKSRLRMRTRLLGRRSFPLRFFPAQEKRLRSRKRIGTLRIKARAAPPRKGERSSARKLSATAMPSIHWKAVKARAAKAISSSSFFMVAREISISNDLRGRRCKTGGIGYANKVPTCICLRLNAHFLYPILFRLCVKYRPY